MKEAEQSAEFRHRELAQKDRKLDIKDREISLTQSEINHSYLTNPLLVAVLAGSLALVGNIAVSISNGFAQRSLERVKSQNRSKKFGFTGKVLTWSVV